MKNTNKYYILILTVLLAACTYDFPEDEEPTPGDADFSKTVAIGSSLTAGFMNGALYNDGQESSFASILAEQMKAVGGGEFNQPDINAEAGFYGVADGIPGVPDGTILGRLHLKGVPSPRPTPIIPGQAITAYTGDKDELNNFSAYGVSIQTAQHPALGGPPTANPLYNPYYGRFASSPGTSTMLGDAVAALADGGTFFIFWLGSDDVLGYATNGADENDPTKPLTGVVAFQGAYTQALNAILDAREDAEGAVANIPDVTSLPYFSYIAYNPIPLDEPTATSVNAGFAGYNAVLDALKGPPFNYSAESVDARKISFAGSANNRIVIHDESVEDYADEFDALEANDAITPEQRAALVPYEQVRQTTASDLIALPAGSILGTAMGGNPQLVYGITVPLSDKYVLIPSEINEIQDRISDFNDIIADLVADNSSRVVLVDVNAILKDLREHGASIGGSTLTASFVPPFGGFSLDGVHPNARGNAFLANKFIETINTKFGSDIPLSNPNDYAGNALPVP